jgi:hypothetical protein
MTSLDSAQSAPEPVAALGEPVRRVSAGWIAAFATVWFAIWMAQLAPIQLLLPAQIDAELHPENWVDSVVAFGVISGVAAVATVIASWKRAMARRSSESELIGALRFTGDSHHPSPSRTYE